MEKKYIKIKEDLHDVGSSLSFDNVINKIQNLKQKYLEDEFLYKHKVEVDVIYTGILVIVSRLETDNEFALRIKKTERAKNASLISAQKAKEKKLAEKIKLFKKLQSQISSHDPKIIEELINQ